VVSRGFWWVLLVWFVVATGKFWRVLANSGGLCVLVRSGGLASSGWLWWVLVGSGESCWILLHSGELRWVLVGSGEFCGVLVGSLMSPGWPIICVKRGEGWKVGPDIS
jgi:hypothetical protein